MDNHAHIATAFVFAFWSTLFWLVVSIFHVWSPPLDGGLLSIGTAIVCGVVFIGIAALTAGLVGSGDIPLWSETASESVIMGSVIWLILAFVAVLVAMPYGGIAWGWVVGATALVAVVLLGLIWYFASCDDEQPKHRHKKWTDLSSQD
jgi:hypothetical protein